MSQLDLALNAEVSARHISFLETGRSRPSKKMVLLLASTLDVPLRDRNIMLREAGFPPAFSEPDINELDPGVEHAIGVMMQKHEPYPMLIIDRCYNVLRMNNAAQCMIAMCVGTVPDRWNALHAFFDENWFRPYVQDWEGIARVAIARLHREVLRTPQDKRLRELLDDLLGSPNIPSSWRSHDLSRGSEGAFNIRFEVGGHVLSFVITMMSFQAPQNVTLEEIQIESYFPADRTTEEICSQVLGGPPNNRLASSGTGLTR